MTQLLQIHEPGQTPEPHEQDKVYAIGIDLGTTHSVVAYSDDQSLEVLPLEGDKSLIPSVVLYSDSGVLVGDNARSSAGENHCPIYSIKRLMGEDHQREGKSPEEISSEILAYLKKRASSHLGVDVSKAVITVPAYFSENARTATRRAARLAGFNVLRLLNEPTAAALAYGLDRQKEGLFLVYDLGGGTFDVTLLKCQKGVFQVLATGGDTALGGDDIDHSLATELFDDFPEVSAHQKTAFLQYAKNVKEFMACHPQKDWVDEEKNIHLTQEVFGQHLTSLLKRTWSICTEVTADASLEDFSKISEIILVGGSTRLPHIWESIEKLFGKKPLCSLNPDQVVAMGAAVQAEALTRGSDHLLLDVTPLSLGLETMGGLSEKIIHRNTPIPCSVAQDFTTHQEGQTAMVIHVVQGEREMVEDCRSLGHFNLKGIPPMPAGMARVRVTFSLDADGLLSVTAEEKTTGIQQSVEIKDVQGLDAEAVLDALKDSAEHAQEDIKKSLLLSAQMDAKQLLSIVGKALDKDRDLLSVEEYEAICVGMASLKTHEKSHDREDLLSAIKHLETLTQPFAERRISRSIAQAMREKNIHDL